MPSLLASSCYPLAITDEVVTAAIVLALVILCYLLVSRGLSLLHKRQKLAAPVVIHLRRILRWFAVAVAVVLLLQAFELLEHAWTMLTAALAILAIGFVAVWSVLSNALCSLIMLIARPFRIGDTITLPPDNLKGKVVNFNMLFTTLRAEDGTFIQVPNNLFFQRVIYRQPGKTEIGLDEQLMENQDAKV